MATEPLYTTQRQLGGGQCAAWLPPDAEPQRPTILQPLGAPQDHAGRCTHLWSCDGGPLRCHWCGWTYRAVLARAQTGGGTP